MTNEQRNERNKKRDVRLIGGRNWTHPIKKTIHISGAVIEHPMPNELISFYIDG